MDDLEDAKEDHIDLEYIHRLQVDAIDEIYEDAKRNDIKSQLILRTLKQSSASNNSKSHKMKRA